MATVIASSAVRIRIGASGRPVTRPPVCPTARCAACKFRHFVFGDFRGHRLSLGSRRAPSLRERRMGFASLNPSCKLTGPHLYRMYSDGPLRLLGRPDCRKKAFDLLLQAIGLLRKFAGRTENQFGG